MGGTHPDKVTLHNPALAYKLLRVRADGSIGPLFINRSQVITTGVWMRAEDHPTPGYAHRPGWHVAPQPNAPHLSTKGRRWYLVLVADITVLERPVCQGGIWWLANWMRVVKPIAPIPTNHRHV